VVPRRATADDLDAIVATLVDSHLDYVWERWALPGLNRRERLATLVRRDFELLGLPHREVWVLEDAAAVAMWIPAVDRSVPSRAALAEVARCVEVVVGDHLPAVEAVESVLRERRPSEPHWFLATMGTRPERQRQGLGTAVLAPVLEELDRIGVPACLETSSTGNVAFYSTLGFEPVAHLDQLPADAPGTWVMWRAPARRRTG
jgi:GNAT superfamily N-acetyltransferase